MKAKSWLLAATVAVAGAVTVAGVVGGAGATTGPTGVDGTGPATPPTPTSGTGAPTPADDDAPLTGEARDRAVTAAVAHVGGGAVTDTEVGDDGAAYGVEVRKPDGIQVEVNLDRTYAVTSTENDDDGPGDDGPDDDGPDDDADDVNDDDGPNDPDDDPGEPPSDDD